MANALSDLIYGYGESNSLAFEVFCLLKNYGKTITAAESLTAGLFQASVADFFLELHKYSKVVCHL